MLPVVVVVAEPVADSDELALADEDDAEWVELDAAPPVPDDPVVKTTSGTHAESATTSKAVQPASSVLICI